MTGEKGQMVASSKKKAMRRVRVLVSLVASVCAAIPSTEAQNRPAAVPQFEVSAEYSYVRANADNANGGFNLNGASGSFAYNINDRFSAVADIGAYRFRGLPNGVDSTMYTYLFGPRFSLRSYGRVVPFAQALVGGGRLNASSSGVKAGENGLQWPWVVEWICDSGRGSQFASSKPSTY
jgi:hypothetical protein